MSRLCKLTIPPSDLTWTLTRGPEKAMSEKKKEKIKNIQQPGFAGGHPPNY